MEKGYITDGEKAYRKAYSIVKKLVKAGILEKKGRGVYKMNFGRHALLAGYVAAKL